jgi:hypothetical protein
MSNTSNKTDTDDDIELSHSNPLHNGNKKAITGEEDGKMPRASNPGAMPCRVSSVKRQSSLRDVAERIRSLENKKLLDEEVDIASFDQWIVLNSRVKGDDIEPAPPSVERPISTKGGDDVETGYLKHSEESTGCRIYEFKEVGKKVVSEEEVQKVEVHYELDVLTEWSKLFNALAENDTEDYVLKEIPYLYLCIYFFFHKSVLRWTIGLLVYIVIIEAITLAAWPGGTKGQMSVFAAILIFVVMSVPVIKGSFEKETVLDSRYKPASNMTSEKVPNLSGDGEKDELVFDAYTDETNPKVLMSLPSVFCRLLSIPWVCKTCGSMCVSDKKVKIKKSGAIEVDNFYDLMEISTHYLCLLGKGNREHSFKPRKVTTHVLVAFLTILIFVQVVNLVATWAYAGACLNTGNDTLFHNSNTCSRTNFKFFVFGFGFISNVGYYLGYCHMVVTFCTLSYGSEVANAMTKYWLLRFIPLRRMDATPGNLLTASDSKEVTTMLRRDAFERYLLTHNYMNTASSLWSTLLFLTLTISCLLFIYAYALILWYLTQDSIAWVRLAAYIFAILVPSLY